MPRRSAKRKRGASGLTNKELTELMKDDILDEITQDFNDLIQDTIKGLTFKVSDSPAMAKYPKVSPVLTGFFSSSWVASTQRPQREKGGRPAPWSELKIVKNPTGTESGDKWVLAPGVQPIIKQRYPVKNTFRTYQKVFIGNTASYTPSALTSRKSNIDKFLYDPVKGIPALIDLYFQDRKRPDLRFGVGQSTEVGSVKYLDLDGN